MHLSRVSALTFAALAAAVGSACGREPAEPAAEEISSSVAPPRDVEALFQMDSLRYALADDGSTYMTNLGVRFTNQTGATTYFVNCNGATSLRLEKLVDGAWKPAWSPILPLCLSQPIVVAAGAVHDSRIFVHAGHPGNNYYPKFAITDLEGIYRIVWNDALSSYQDRLPFGDPLPLVQRVSNRFALTVERR
jgi:hypothetical protein